MLAIEIEFDNCQAGGLPPPAQIPTEQESRQMKAAEEARQAAEEEQKQEEEEMKNKAEEDERAKHMEVDTLGLTEEMDLVTLSMPKNEPGVSAGSSEEDPVAKSVRARGYKWPHHCQVN